MWQHCGLCCDTAPNFRRVTHTAASSDVRAPTCSPVVRRHLEQINRSGSNLHLQSESTWICVLFLVFLSNDESFFFRVRTSAQSCSMKVHPTAILFVLALLCSWQSVSSRSMLLQVLLLLVGWRPLLLGWRPSLLGWSACHSS